VIFFFFYILANISGYQSSSHFSDMIISAC